MRYVAKPVQVDGWLWTGNVDDLPASEWATGLYTLRADGVLIVDTMNGPAEAIPDVFYVVKGTKGERYPVRRDVMAEKYAAIREEES